MNGKLVCRAPKGGLTSELAAALKERRTAIVDFLREGLAERGGMHAIPPIRPVERQELNKQPIKVLCQDYNLNLKNNKQTLSA